MRRLREAGRCSLIADSILNQQEFPISQPIEVVDSGLDFTPIHDRLSFYVNEGILQRLDRMNDEQREAFLTKLKPHERENLLKRLDLYRKAKAKED